MLFRQVFLAVFLCLKVGFSHLYYFSEFVQSSRYLVVVEV
jgi:hypothetical protein